jgi:perosamine synthetase
MRPWLEEAEWETIKDVILSGWVSQGPKVKEFEDRVAAFVGAKHAVATNSCTSAIHLGLRTQGVGAGHEVILANTTCMANVNAIAMAGATPVFVDIDPDNYNLNPVLIDGAITERTKAILIIDQIGLAADLDAIRSIADKHNLVIVDDAATALGGEYKGTRLGGHGLVATFSFHPRKMITTGEGGMLLTDNDEIAAQARVLRSAGASVSDLERHKAKGTILQKYHVCGYNYRMTDIQAAIGLIQMNRLPTILQERARQGRYYNNVFANNEGLITPFVPNYAKHTYSSYMLKTGPKVEVGLDEILSKLAEKGISARYGIPPLHREPYFDGHGYSDEMFPVSCSVAKSTFFIPIFPGLTDDEMQYVAETVRSIVK